MSDELTGSKPFVPAGPPIYNKEERKNDFSKACRVCKCEPKDPSFSVPRMVFTSLEGSPFICEKCMARAFGVDVPWIKEIEDKLKEKEI